MFRILILFLTVSLSHSYAGAKSSSSSSFNFEKEYETHINKLSPKNPKKSLSELNQFISQSLALSHKKDPSPLSKEEKELANELSVFLRYIDLDKYTKEECHSARDVVLLSINPKGIPVAKMNFRKGAQESLKILSKLCNDKNLARAPTDEEFR